MHGGKDQEAGTNSIDIELFGAGKIAILIVIDVALGEVDIPFLTILINFDFQDWPKFLYT